MTNDKITERLDHYQDTATRRGKGLGFLSEVLDDRASVNTAIHEALDAKDREIACQKAELEALRAAQPVAMIEFIAGQKEPRLMSWNEHPPGQYRLYAAPQSTKDTAALIEIDKVMLQSGAHWPDVETDALVVRHVKELTRMLNADRAEVEALRAQVSRAYQAGTDDFRRFYDAELFKVIGVSGFRDLYAPAGSVAHPTTSAQTACRTCSGHGLIGGMTVEGGEGWPCPDCSPEAIAQAVQP